MGLIGAPVWETPEAPEPLWEPLGGDSGPIAVCRVAVVSFGGTPINSTQELECSSFLVMTYFLLRDYNVLPKKELLWSPWVWFMI